MRGAHYRETAQEKKDTLSFKSLGESFHYVSFWKPKRVTQPAHGTHWIVYKHEPRVYCVDGLRATTDTTHVNILKSIIIKAMSQDEMVFAVERLAGGAAWSAAGEGVAPVATPHSIMLMNFNLLCFSSRWPFWRSEGSRRLGEAVVIKEGSVVVKKGVVVARKRCETFNRRGCLALCLFCFLTYCTPLLLASPY